MRRSGRVVARNNHGEGWKRDRKFTFGEPPGHEVPYRIGFSIHEVLSLPLAPSLPFGQAAEHLVVKLRPDLVVQPQFYEGT